MLRTLSSVLSIVMIAAVTCVGQSIRTASERTQEKIDVRLITDASKLPDWVDEEDFGVLPENPNDQPEFLSSSPSMPSEPSAMVDGSSGGSWDPQFGMNGLNFGADVRAIAVAGDEIYVGGRFLTANGHIANNIAMWNGRTWDTLGEGVDDAVYTIAVSGPNVYVGGAFRTAGGIEASRIAVWNRTTRTWSRLGEGIGGHRLAYVATMALDGDDLYVGGRFLTAGRLVSVNVAKWHDNRWERVGTGTNGYVFTMALQGNDLYVGGRFTVAGDKPVERIARVDRATNEWYDIGGVRSRDSGYVGAIAEHDGIIYVGGRFQTVGPSETTVNGIARYDIVTRTWYAMGSGLLFHGKLADIYATVVHENHLYVGGTFDGVDTLTKGTTYRAYNLARWDVTAGQWDLMKGDPAASSAFSSGVSKSQSNPYVTAIAIGPHGKVVLGGNFDYVGPFRTPEDGYFNGVSGNVAAYGVCSFDGEYTWAFLGSRITGGTGGVQAIAISGDDLFIGGSFSQAGSIPAGNLARWNHTTGKWTGIGSGVNGLVRSIAISGDDLYVGGLCHVTVDSARIYNLMRWNMSSRRWDSLGVTPYRFNDQVNCVAATEGKLYVGSGQGIHLWDGNEWSPLGSNVDAPVRTISVDGDRIYVGGDFSHAGDMEASAIAVWNSTTGTWSSLGSGVVGMVEAILIDGDMVYVGGFFSLPGETAQTNIAVWDTRSERWQALGSGIDGIVETLTLLDGDLVAGGEFRTIDGRTVNNVARWDGSVWQPVGQGVTRGNGTAFVTALATLGDDLYVGGEFTLAGSIPSYNLGRWRTATSISTVERTPRTTTEPGLWIAPNPASSASSIRFRLDRAEHVSLALYDMAGRRVALLVDGPIEAGEHIVELENKGIPPGTYLCGMRSDTTSASGVLLIIR